MSELRSTKVGSTSLPYIKRPDKKLMPWAIEISGKLAAQRQILEGHLEKLAAIDELLRAATLEIANNLKVPGTLEVTGASTLTGAVTAAGNVQALAFLVSANQVVGARKTGWAAPTGTSTRTTFATSTVTTEQLAERVKALLEDTGSSSGHGLIDV